MLAWIDTETTGLDPEKGLLLEVAIVVTTPQLIVVDGATWVIKHDLSAVWDLCDDYVRKMHEANGLFAELEDGKPIEVVRKEALEFLTRTRVPQRSPMCGSTVSFDRAWLKRHMSELAAWFNHRHLDVSSEKICADLWDGGWKPKDDGAGPAHRALADVMASIDHAQQIRARYFKRGEEKRSAPAA